MKPVVLVGKGDVSEALIKETVEALATHELIKVKILESSLMDRHEVGEELGNACGAEVAQTLGRTLLLYKAAKEPRLELPKGDKDEKSPKAPVKAPVKDPKRSLGAQGAKKYKDGPTKKK